MRPSNPLLLALLLATAPLRAASAEAPSTARAIQAARDHVAAHEPELIGELRRFLALPNLASDAAGIRANADALVAMLERRGVHASLLETPGAPVTVFGEIGAPGATRTLMFYAHFDGQPIGPPEQWATPPFQPTLRSGRLEDGAPVVAWDAAKFPLDDEARIYARSSSDDKAPILAMLAALDALKAAKIPLSANLKFFLEGEEEAGSPALARTLAAHRERLRSDLWLFGDGPIDPRGLPRIALGVRGITSFRLTVYGPATSLHSGHYGNVAPNPAARLAHLIATMRADDGRITIDGLQASPPSEQALALARDAFDTAGMLAGPQLGGTESGLSYGESVLRPALNVTQLMYGGSGEQRNAIDPSAVAGFDLRLTPGLSPAQARERIEAHVRAQGYTLLDAEPTAEQRRTLPRLARLEFGELGYPSATADLDHAGVRRVIDTWREATGDAVRIAPLMGGSLPIASIGEVLGVPFVIVPIVNADNNQHAPNENLRMRELRRGVELYAALLADAGRW